MRQSGDISHHRVQAVRDGDNRPPDDQFNQLHQGDAEQTKSLHLLKVQRKGKFDSHLPTRDFT